MNSSLHFLIHSNVPRVTSYYKSNFGSLDNNIRMSGYPHHILEEILSGVCLRAQKEEAPTYIIHNYLDNSVQGILLPEQSAGIFGFDVYDSEELNFLASIQSKEISAIQKNLKKARETYLKARTIHDEQEKIYIDNMDFEAANRLTEETIHKLLDGKKSGHTGSGIDRFFGAATVNGNINYIPEVTRHISKRYLIKGRPGTGKSTFLKKIAQAAISHGFNTELYHCALDPNSLDLVAVRELDFCLFDSTPPHEYFPTQPGDEIIDIYQKCVTPGTDEKYQAELEKLQIAYKEILLNAAVCLKNVKRASDRFDELLPQPEKTEIEEQTAELIRRIF